MTKKNSLNTTIKDIIWHHAIWPEKRSKYQITVKEICEEVGISHKQYYLWEGGLITDSILRDFHKFIKIENAMDKIIQKKKKQDK